MGEKKIERVEETEGEEENEINKKKERGNKARDLERWELLCNSGITIEREKEREGEREIWGEREMGRERDGSCYVTQA